MDVESRLELLWIGFRTLRSLEEGCLDRKRVSVCTVSSFDAGLGVMARGRADIVVLSVTASGRRLADQIERARSLVADALIAVVVCNQADAESARDAGADDVMALEREGELVCAPVLRWVEMRRRGNNGLIDLRAATRRRRGLEAEIATLHAEVASLSRQAVHDPASGELGRGAFVIQVELAARLLCRHGGALHLFLFELGDLGANGGQWGDFVIGGVHAKVGEMLREVLGDDSVIGRVGPSRFAVMMTDGSDEDAAWLGEVARNRLASIEVPLGGGPRVSVLATRVDLGARSRPGRRALEELEGALDCQGDATRILRRA